MEMIIDVSAILAVILDEPERDRIIAITKGCTLEAPDSFEFEIGNTLSSLLKRGVISIAQAVAIYHEYAKIPLRLLPVDILQAIVVSGEANICAYDSYFIVCAERMERPILTLDRKLASVARTRGIRLVEA